MKKNKSLVVKSKKEDAKYFSLGSLIPALLYSGAVYRHESNVVIVLPFEQKKMADAVVHQLATHPRPRPDYVAGLVVLGGK